MTEREGRGRATVRNPAEAIAMAKCWLASWGGSETFLNLNQDSFHPAECGYCEVPNEVKVKVVAEFIDWSGTSAYEPRPLRLEIESWETLPHEEQARLVAKAAGLIEEDEPEDRRSPW